MGTNELANIAVAVKDKKVDELKSFIADKHDVIVTETTVAYLPEEVFVEYFLDYFKAGGNLDMSSGLSLKWLELSGGPYNEVIIIDVAGNDIFTVPSLYIKPDIDMSKMDGIDISNIASEFKLRENRLPEDGINYLNNQLSGLDTMVDSNFIKSVNTWKSIFSRYDNTKTKATSNGKTTVTQQAALSKLSGMLDYD